MAELKRLTGYAQLIVFAMGKGKRLRVGFDTVATLVDPWSDFGQKPPGAGERAVWPAPPIGPLSKEAARELIESGLVRKYTEHGESGAGWRRAGWRESGLDGTKADFYCLLQ